MCAPGRGAAAARQWQAAEQAGPGGAEVAGAAVAASPRASIAKTGRARTRRTLACRSVRGPYVLTVVSRCLAHVYVLFCELHQIIAIKVLGVKLEMKVRFLVLTAESLPALPEVLLTLAAFLNVIHVYMFSIK